MWGILFIIFYALCILAGSGIIWIPVLIHLYRKSAKDHREHPEKYRNRKPDNNCYWID